MDIGGPNIDLSKVPGLNQRRSVTFFNHYVMHSVNFLNNFSAVADQKLAKQSLEIQKLEIAMNILEAKLASIPGLENVGSNKEASSAGTPAAPNTTPSGTGQTAGSVQPTPMEVVVEEPANIPQAENVVTVKQDPRYAKFLKMVNVGVPKVAIENKMRLEGLDPSLLDTPDAAVPDAAPAENEDSDNESQSLSSGDDFSD